MVRGTCIVTLALMATATCQRTEEGPAALVVDSAGIVVVESPTARHSGTTEWEVGRVELVLGQGAVELNDVVGVTRLSLGSFVVADGGDARLLYFGTDGTLTDVVGGPGDGPGEFRILQAIGTLPGDSVWAYDFSHARVTVFAPDRERARVTTLSPQPHAGLAVGALSDGSFLVGESWAVGVSESTTPGLSREPVAYARYRPDGSLADTLTMFPGREVLLWQDETGRGVMGAAPFGRHAVHGLLGDALVLGDQVAHEVRLVDRSGRTTRIIRWRAGDLELSQDDIEAWREARLSEADDRDRSRVRAELSNTPLPELRPAYERLLVAGDGRIWIMDFARPGGDTERWRVFDRDGSWLATIDMPGRFALLAVTGDEVLGVELGPFDEQSVVVRSLRGSSGNAP